MFELSDDDDNFWNDVPLGDIINLRSTENSAGKPEMDLRKPDDEDSNPAKRPCVSKKDFPSASEVTPPGDHIPTGTRAVTGSATEGRTQLVSRTTTSPAQHKQIPTSVICRDKLMTPVGTSSKANPGSTPRRPRRKFPGPAGLLPKLNPGQSMDSVTIPGVTVADPDKSGKEDSVILSSQSTDEVFLDTPWQTLLSDLEAEGSQLMKKFSIASISLMAGKKQLARGKVAMVFAVIERLDTHGSDASVTLRDKSGRIQGTVHRDLLKDYEAELQPGTVIVLRQVSVISLTNKNHYLNITPSNIVVIYQNKNSQLQKVKFHGSQDSLHSILVSLEKKTYQNSVERNTRHGTPNSSSSSRLSSGNSSASTPVLFNTMLNQTMDNLRNQGSGSSTPRVQGVRDVRFTPSAPGIRDVRYTPGGVRTPSASIRQNICYPTTGGTGIVGSNPQTPGTNHKGNFQEGMRSTPVQNTNKFRLNSNSVQAETADVPLNSSFATQITPAEKGEEVDSNNLEMNASVRQGTALSFNRSVSASSINEISGTFQAPNIPNVAIPTSSQSELFGRILADSSSTPVVLSASSDTGTASHEDNPVKSNSVSNNSDRKISPESNSNKRKWSFKSPALSPNMNSVAQTGVSNVETNICGVSSQTKNTFKRVNSGKGLNSDVLNLSSESIDANCSTSKNSLNECRIPGSLRVTETKSTFTNSASHSRQGLGNLKSRQSLGIENFGDFNNNKSSCSVNIRDTSSNNSNGNNSEVNIKTMTKSKWSFKSKTITSPTVPEKFSSSLMGLNGSTDTSVANQKTEDLWQDDISDELLSQLSDEMF